MLLIDESIQDDGQPQRTFLAAVLPAEPGGEGGVRLIAEDGASGFLSMRALATVMERYGKPLDEGVSADGPWLELGQGRRLQTLRYRAQVDASSRDYLVWHAPGAEPLAALSRSVAAVLRYLVERLAAAGKSG